MSQNLPAWLRPLVDAAENVTPDELSPHPMPESGGRTSAVLVLFGEGAGGPDVLLIERSRGSRYHPGQAAFPGGATESFDAGPVETALREAVEETGLVRDGVDIAAVLPPLWLPPSRFVVVPVLGWWRAPSAVAATDIAEIAAVARVPIAKLVDPVNRFRLRHPSGQVGPAFRVDDLLVWGFTAGVLDCLLDLGGWARPWNADDVRDLPDAAASVSG